MKFAPPPHIFICWKVGDIFHQKKERIQQISPILFLIASN
jgi:hypothetical protein